MKRSLSCLLVSTLIWTCPGLAAYAAAGETIGAFNSASAARTLPHLASSALGLAPSAAVNLIKTGVEISAVPIVVSDKADAPVQPAAQVQLAEGVKQLTKNPSQVRTILQKIFTGGRLARNSEALPTDVPQASNGQNSGLTPSDGLKSEAARPPSPPSDLGPSGQPMGPSGSKLLGLVATLGRVAAAGAAVVGLHTLAANVLPAIFGLNPVAAVWAVSSAVFLLPAALFSRYLLSQHDSKRLKTTKWVMDAAIGLVAGGLFIAASSLSIATSGASVLLAGKLLVAAGTGTYLSKLGGASILNAALGGVAITALPVILGTVGAGAIGLGPLLAMMAIPAMTAISFFLGTLVKSAETGRPFSVPGSMQKMRFPSFNWIMLGVVFALLSGYGAVNSYLTNGAFVAWMLLSNKSDKKGEEALADGITPLDFVLAPIYSIGTKLFGDRFANRFAKFANGLDSGGRRLPSWAGRVFGFLLNFDVLYLGLLAFTAATAFSSPLTFLVIAFSPERAASWTERLLKRLLPKGSPAPSTFSKPVVDPDAWLDKVQQKAPRFHHWLKTFVMLGTMLALGFVGGTFVFGTASLLKNLGVGVLMAALPYFFSDKLVVAMMKAQPTDQAQDPEFFGIMNELRERINEKRAAKGQKLIPMPKMVNVPMDIPNAFATGRDPFHAVVGVTMGIKEMLLDPENLRQELETLVASADPAGKSFRVFRRAIAGSITGVDEMSAPSDISQALARAQPAQLKALGVRLLRGVLGHEFSHVMDRHMLTGSISGAIATGISFASYGVLWKVGHYKQAISARIQALHNTQSPGQSSVDIGGAESKITGAKPEVVDPVTAGLILKTLPIFAAQWGPLIVSIMQMSGSRNNEAQADDDGAALTGDPEALALSLGLLTTWKPKDVAKIANFNNWAVKLPVVAAAAGMFTVNPIEELQAAGALPASGAPGNRDNWMFDLFVTHPDTRWRIETLDDISEGMGHVNRPPKAK